MVMNLCMGQSLTIQQKCVSQYMFFWYYWLKGEYCEYNNFVRNLNWFFCSHVVHNQNSNTGMNIAKVGQA